MHPRKHRRRRGQAITTVFAGMLAEGMFQISMITNDSRPNAVTGEGKRWSLTRAKHVLVREFVK